MVILWEPHRACFLGVADKRSPTPKPRAPPSPGSGFRVGLGRGPIVAMALAEMSQRRSGL